MWAIVKKEFKTIFYSPMGYIVVAMFLIVYSTIFYATAIASGSVDLSSTYYWTAVYGLPFIMAILTMRSFAEERSKGTGQLLEISPKSIFSIVMGKFFSMVGVICVTLIISFMYYFILLKFGNPDIKLVLITMIGFILLSMAYISFGMLVSSLTENQVIAAVVTLVFSLIPFFISYGDGIFSNLALINLFQKFPTNVISLKEIVGLLSFTIMCITITIIVIQRKKCLK